MNLPEPLEKLKDIKNANWIGLAVTLALNITLMFGSLYMDPDIGYYVMMVGLVAITFLVLYIFGWRDGKKLAVVGILLFILMGAVWGPMTVHRSYQMEEPDPVFSAAHINWFTKEYEVLNTSTYSAGGTVYAEDIGIFTHGGYVYAMDNGILTPYQDDAGTVYNFTITLYSNDSFPDGPDLEVAYALGVEGTISITNMREVDSNDISYEDGKEFYYQATIDKEGIYSHVYCLKFEDAYTNSLNTTVALGPLVGDETASYGYYALIGIPSMFCNIGMLFVMLVLLYWWTGTAKEKRMSWDRELERKEKVLEGEMDESELKPFTCDACGASVGVEDNFCPKCGERFDEVEGEADDKEEPGPEKVPEEASESEEPDEPEE